MVLDTSAEVFIGQVADLKEQQNAFEISQEHIKIAALLEDYIALNPAKHFTFVSHSAGGTLPRRSGTLKYFNWRISNASIALTL